MKKSKIDILINQLDTTPELKFGSKKFKMGIDWPAIHLEQDKEFMRDIIEKCKRK